MTSSVGLCWLSNCKKPGIEIVSGHWRIVLCSNHKWLLESSSQIGYSSAEPPPGSDVWWPWEER